MPVLSPPGKKFKQDPDFELSDPDFEEYQQRPPPSPGPDPAPTYPTLSTPVRTRSRQGRRKLLHLKDPVVVEKQLREPGLLVSTLRSLGTWVGLGINSSVTSPLTTPSDNSQIAGKHTKPSPTLPERTPSTNTWLSRVSATRQRPPIAPCKGGLGSAPQQDTSDSPVHKHPVASDPSSPIPPPRRNKRKLTLGPQPSAQPEEWLQGPDNEVGSVGSHQFYKGLPAFPPLQENFEFSSACSTSSSLTKDFKGKIKLEIKPDISQLQKEAGASKFSYHSSGSSSPSFKSFSLSSRSNFQSSLQTIRENIWASPSSSTFKSSVWNPPLAVLWQAKKSASASSVGTTAGTSKATTASHSSTSKATATYTASSSSSSKGTMDVATTYFLPPTAQLEVFYDGTGSIKDFVQKFELLALSYGWTDADKLKYLPHYLKESANAWYDIYRTGKANQQGKSYSVNHLSSMDMQISKKKTIRF